MSTGVLNVDLQHQEVEGNVAQVAANTSGLRGQLDQVLGLLTATPGAASGAGLPPGAGLPAAPDAAVVVGGAPAAGPAVRPVDGPLLTPIVCRMQLEALLPVIGVSPARVADLLGRMDGLGLPWQAVWDDLRSLKGLQQWVRKINVLLDSDHHADAFDANAVGNFLYSRVRQDQTVSQHDLQAPLHP